MEGPVRTALREPPVGRVPSHFERGHARGVRLEGQHLQVEEEAHVLLKGVGHARGSAGQLSRSPAGVALLHPLDAPLDLADAVQVAVHPLQVHRAQLAPQVGHLTGDPVQDAPVGPPPPCPLVGAPAGPEEHVERGARAADHRQRQVGRCPTDRVHVRARVVVVAAAPRVRGLDGKLERRQHRVLPEALGVQLIQRGAAVDVGPLGLLGVGLRQEHRAGAEVVAAHLRRREGLRHAHVGVADDGHVVTPPLEPLQHVDVAELEVPPLGDGGEEMLPGAPLVAAGDAVHLLDADQACRLAGRAPARNTGGNHGVEQRKREGGARPAQEGASRKSLAGQNMHATIQDEG